MSSKYGICHLAQAPIRETISHASEMVSELLFGDLIEIKDKYQNWFKIESVFDGYEGWVDEKQFVALNQEEYEMHRADKSEVFSADFVSEVERNADHSVFRIGMGCRLPLYENGALRLGKWEYTCKNAVIEPEKDAEAKRKVILERAYSMLNTPYLWGGRSSRAVDCSGFTQLIYRTSGISLLRDASLQATQGTIVHLLAEAQAGDLLFFDNENEQIVHVGIYDGNGHILHCSGSVRVDPVDHEGIFKQERGGYSHALRLIKRVI